MTRTRPQIYLADARKLGVQVLQPDINESVGNFTAVGNDVRFGLASIRNVGEAVIESLVASRKSKGKYTSFADFLDKADIAALNKRAVDAMIKGGSFDSLGHSRKGLSAVHEDAIDSVIPVKKAAAIGQDDLFETSAATTATDRPSAWTSPSTTASGRASSCSPPSAKCSACTSPRTHWTAPSTSCPGTGTPRSANSSRRAALKAWSNSPDSSRASTAG